MRKKFKWRDYLSWGLFVASAVLLICAMSVLSLPGDVGTAASRLEHKLDRRMKELDGYAVKALEITPDEWQKLSKIPHDMVVYRYVRDTLQSWYNSFTAANDDIVSKVIYPRLANPLINISSPLADVGEETSYVNLGQKWYLVRSFTKGDVKVIAGLEVMNALDNRSMNNVNPRFRLGDKFSIKTLDFSGGAAVCVDEIPQFKLLNYSLKPFTPADSLLVWLALLLFILALLVLLSAHRELRYFRIVMSLAAAVLLWMYFWGAAVQNSAHIFSPTLYADGRLLYSLGAVLVLNLAVISLVLCTYMVRKDIFKAVLLSHHRKRALVLMLAVELLVLVGILAYTHLTFSSIVLNSNICLEVYKLNELNQFTLVVYMAFIAMLVSVMLVIQMMRPCIKQLLGIRIDAFSPAGRSLIALCAGLYFVITAAVLGFRKERDSTEVWAGRLSVERDISLELRLRQVEGSIANDVFISTLSALPNAASAVFNRIIDSYMYSISQDYDISVMLLDGNEKDPAVLSFFNERVRKGSPIVENSRFLYTTTVSGQARYTGLFTYLSREHGASYMLLGVEPKSNRDYRGYSNLLGMSNPGKVVMPAIYSYARYSDEKLISYKGSYAYPTLITDYRQLSIDGRFHKHYSKGGYTHFMTFVDDNEFVIISRPRLPLINYIVAAVVLSLAMFMTLSVASLTRRRKRVSVKSYFRSRISAMLMGSLFITLIVMAVVSVLFVYGRNDANKNEMMSDRITSITSLIGDSFRYVNDFRELNTQELAAEMDNVAKTARVDLTLYSPSGRVFRTTSPDVFDRMVISDRINQTAYYNIMYGHMRYCINRERLAGKNYYALYAPLMNESSKIVAILCTPYVEENYDFETEAVMHSVTILSVFLVLLLLTRFMMRAVMEKMFKPLIEMGHRMNSTDVRNLEYIEYDREDEISTLVKAYNMMVRDLRESTRQLAQAERDKAWSSMARQVAHEIKNPLTPMKLQIQRLIRMKERNLPGWEDKFSEAAKIVLDHIDILTDTANEFSTFAKLYSEEPSLINLDALLQEEISMFDNRDDIIFSYFGLSGVIVRGPKPQLTRVFVNLLTNSIQAIETARQEAIEDGRDPVMGRIVVSLRHSVSGDGYYDIVFEDNGPGVSSDNVNKLFTPNFTTKSSGTGLGLAISRSIIEKCDGTITYSKSFGLEGACFTIKYPVSQS